MTGRSLVCCLLLVGLAEEMRRLTLFMDAQGAYISHDHDAAAQLRGEVVDPVME